MQEGEERGQVHFNSFVDDFSPYIRLDRLASNKLAHEGLVALRNGDRESARRAFREAMRLDPTTQEFLSLRPNLSATGNRTRVHRPQ